MRLEVGLDADVGENFQEELGLADTGFAHDGEVGVGVLSGVV